ncbi:hypothetical protein MJ575_27805 [Klebsiella pneumoniae]|nr:hypothetical protein MJ575_27805 [Klebsiella pneumoniae]
MATLLALFGRPEGVSGRQHGRNDTIFLYFFRRNIDPGYSQSMMNH